jgi:hypothetical protein
LCTLIATLTGCFSAEMKLTVRDDDTADLTYTLLVDIGRLTELAEILGGGPEDAAELEGDALIDELFNGDDPCSELSTAVGDQPVESQAISEGGRRGVRCTARRIPLSQLTDLGTDTTVRIDRRGSTTDVEITLAGIEDLAGDGDDLGAGLGLSFTDLVELRFVVSAPGSVTRHNGSSIDGATVTWVITPDADFVAAGVARLDASWTGDGSGSGSAGLIILVILLGVVVIAVAVVGALMARARTARRLPGSPLPPPPAPPVHSPEPSGSPEWPQPGGGAER